MRTFANATEAERKSKLLWNRRREKESKALFENTLLLKYIRLFHLLSSVPLSSLIYHYCTKDVVIRICAHCMWWLYEGIKRLPHLPVFLPYKSVAPESPIEQQVHRYSLQTDTIHTQNSIMSVRVLFAVLLMTAVKEGLSEARG